MPNFLRFQLKIYSVYRTVNMMFFRRADDRGGNFCQQPRERDFSHGNMILPCKLSHPLYNFPILIGRVVVLPTRIIILSGS
ncbi:hypothetical protein EC841_1011308 [Raoultella ornithinolytica]|uniref:Uncharacterized protein n=1 Tax=Raoultella ornithinolytica TaxID=54291 RepID=A0ABD7QR78_RAOOR|nr:hypothetical protein EC841_1011308 [Raoultella ornithinolytica]